MDHFVIEALTQRLIETGEPISAAYIRSCSYFPEGRTLVYHIGGNRFCERIGRSHRSNHVAMIVDLPSGTMYQKCMDPDCRAANYRSPRRLLPVELLGNWQQQDVCNDDEFGGLEDDDLMTWMVSQESGSKEMTTG